MICFPLSNIDRNVSSYICEVFLTIRHKYGRENVFIRVPFDSIEFLVENGPNSEPVILNYVYFYNLTETLLVASTFKPSKPCNNPYVPRLPTTYCFSEGHSTVLVQYVRKAYALNLATTVRYGQEETYPLVWYVP